LTELARLIQSKGIELDLPITLTQKMQKDLGKNLEQLSVEVEKTQTWRLTAKNQEDSDKDE
ncbi:ribonuclease D, partial [Fischerella thermalis CCMEE 5273]